MPTGREGLTSKIVTQAGVADSARIALELFLKGKGINISEDDSKAIGRAWMMGQNIEINCGPYCLKTVRPEKTGDNVVEVFVRGLLVGAETKELNELIYQATYGNWFKH